MHILLNRAAADLRAASSIIDSPDEYDVQLAAFHIQQCIEKLLKLLLLRGPGMYPDTSDITRLVVELHQCDVPNNFRGLIDYIAQRTALLNSWEWESRYGFNFHVIPDEVREALAIAERLCVEVSNTEEVSK